MGLPHLLFLPPTALSLPPSPSQRALVLLYLLLALGFVIFMALAITNTQRGESSTRKWIAPAKREAGTILGGKGQQTEQNLWLLSPVSAVQEALVQAQLQGERSHTTAWHNLSQVQHALGMKAAASGGGFSLQADQNHPFWRDGDGHGLVLRLLLLSSS